MIPRSSEVALSLELIESSLRTRWLGRSDQQGSEPACSRRNELWDEIDSTNNRIIELAKNQAAPGLMVIARSQTAGRGRLGRTWISPIDAGVYFSFLLRSNLPPHHLPIITLAAGGAVVVAIERVAGVSIGLKWVNDLVYQHRKVGGILAEMTPMMIPNMVPALVLGIGLNISCELASIPFEIKNQAIWLESFCSRKVDRNWLIAETANELERLYELLENGDAQAVIEEWKRYTVTLGKEIRAISGNKQFEGVAVDLNKNGALIVQLSDGKREVLPAGEISIRGIDGSYS